MLSKYGNCTRLRQIKTSLRSKRFRLVSEQKKTVERDFRLWPRTLVPHSLLLNRTETLATQAKLKLSSKSVVFTNKVGKNSGYFVDVLNKTIPLALVGYEMIIASASLAIYHLISNVHSWNNCEISTKWTRQAWFSPFKLWSQSRIT